MKRLQDRVAIVTYTDTDGDLVTITFSKKTGLDASDFVFDTAFDATGPQKLLNIDLSDDSDLTGTNITMKVAKVGDGAADVGAILASGIKLGKVVIQGDLRQITVGDGAEGANFVSLFKLFMIVCSVMYVIIVAAMLVAVWRRRRSALTVDDRRHHETSHVVTPALFGWTALVVVGLTILTVASFLTDRSNAANAYKPAMHLTVTANQWWWDVRYDGPQPDQIFHTANEIHVPVGEPVLVRLHGGDVIHSFWVPRLSGKTDLIPGQTNQAWIEADRPGIYRGQCAEYCGAQHAHMAFEVVAEPRAAFDRWRARQLQTAPPPASEAQAAGFALFASRCGMCHSIRGTSARASAAPDLTHLMSRRTLAAGTLPNNPQSLTGWIENPQAIKPGALMPDQGLSAADLNSLRAYLETLR